MKASRLRGARCSAILSLCLLAATRVEPSRATEIGAERASGSVPPAFPAMQGILEDCRDLHVGSAYDAAGRQFKIGHLRLDFRSGSLYAILTKSGREAGFIYDGADAHYAYTTEDKGDLQSIEKNILKFVNTIASRDGTLQEDMKGWIFVATSPTLPSILRPGATAKGQASSCACS